MSDSKTRTAHGQAQFEKKQIAAREGEKAMAHFDSQGRAVRANMVKLKALRLAKEAAEAAAAPAVKPVAKKKRAAKAAAAPKLSEWLEGEKKGGRQT